MLDEMVMCVKASDVEFFEGFTEFTYQNETAADHLFHLLDSATFRLRSNIEDDESLKQIIVYVIISDGEKIYRYARACGEEKLVGDYSIGIGGHVNIDDSQSTDFYHEKAVRWAAIREFVEGVGANNECIDEYIIGPIGVINDNSNPVGRVHLGIVFQVELNGLEIYPRDKNIHKAGLADFEELVQYLDDYENWSQLIILNYMEKDS